MVASSDHPELPFVEAAGYTNGRPDGPPLWLIVHTMEAQEASTTAENTANYFANPGDGRQVSAHYCCDNNSIVQCVELADSAWTVGNTPGNHRGINYEFAGFANQTPPQWGDAYSTAMLERVAPYFRSDAARYNIPLQRCSVDDLKAFRPGVTSHNDLRLAFGVTTHTDPGPNFPWDWFMDLLVEGDSMDVYELHALLLSILTADTPVERQVRDMIQGGVQSPATGRGLLSKVMDAVEEVDTSEPAPVDIPALVAALTPEIRIIVREELDKTHLAGTPVTP